MLPVALLSHLPAFVLPQPSADHHGAGKGGGVGVDNGLLPVP